MNVKEVSEHTHLAPQTIYNLIHTKGIPFQRVSPRKVIFDKKEIDQWMAERNKEEKRGRRRSFSEKETKNVIPFRRKGKGEKARSSFEFKRPVLVLSVTSLIMLMLGWTGRLIFEKAAAPPMNAELAQSDSISIQSLINNAKIGNVKMSESVLENDRVKIKLDYINDIELEGNVDSDYIKSLLIYTLKNEDENYAVRSKTIDIVKPLISQDEVRKTLIQVLRDDKDPAIRMKAATVLSKVAEDIEVKRAMLDRLKNDNNVGVRFKALEVLERIVDKEIIAAIEKATANEKNDIIKKRQELILNKFKTEL